MNAITRHDECTALGETNQHRVLNAAADYVENTAQALGLGIRVMGGWVFDGWAHQPERPTLKLSVLLAPNLRNNVTACRRLSERLCRAFNCEKAGVDITQDIVWIIGMKRKEPSYL